MITENTDMRAQAVAALAGENHAREGAQMIEFSPKVKQKRRTV